MNEPATVSGVFVWILRHPGEALFRRWNYKSAVLSSLLRGGLFFAVNLRAGPEAATAAMLTEWSFRACTSGFYGALTQAFRRAEPQRLAMLCVTPAAAGRFPRAGAGRSLVARDAGALHEHRGIGAAHGRVDRASICLRCGGARSSSETGGGPILEDSAPYARAHRGIRHTAGAFLYPRMPSNERSPDECLACHVRRHSDVLYGAHRRSEAAPGAASWWWCLGLPTRSGISAAMVASICLPRPPRRRSIGAIT